jgi:hypothetical protein
MPLLGEGYHECASKRSILIAGCYKKMNVSTASSPTPAFAKQKQRLICRELLAIPKVRQGIVYYPRENPLMRQVIAQAISESIPPREGGSRPPSG